MPSHGRNWPLLIGACLVGVTVLLAAAGPTLAVHDPLQTFFITQVDGRWVRAPFPAFTVPGFPLGTDRFGRDLWSRLLWGVRPTLILVSIVAAIRLTLGMLAGVSSGWSSGRVGRALDALISLALSAPVLIVALGAIALLGRTLDFWAFVIGLSITGWAETARIMREEARTIKGQPYVEAARALGQSGLRTVVRHVLRQVMPMTWMLLSVEVSTVLLAVASLGFLGYYVGGVVWIMVSDFAASRATGMPELGEMLANSATVLNTQPWSMLVVGAAVFLVVLGFNLLSDGLRQQLELEARRRNSAYNRVTSLVGERIESGVLTPLSARWARQAFRWRFAAAVFAGMAIAAGVFAWQAQANWPALSVMEVPGGHVWGVERRDPQGTHATDASGPTQPIIQWAFHDPTGLSGGPAIARDGTLYVASISGTLYAINPLGQTVWTTTLQSQPFGGPALGVAGEVYVAEAQGGLSALNADGQPLWRFQPEAPARAMAGPLVGPDSTLYHTVEGYILALAPDGALKWRAPVPYSFFNPSPRLSPKGDVIFFADVAVDAATGRVLVGESVNPLDQFTVGADGRIYMLAEKALLEWQPTDQGAAIVQVAPLDYTRQFPSNPTDSGVLPQQQLMWLLFSNEYQDTRLVWMDLNGRVTGAVQMPMRLSWIAGIDRSGVVYLCGAPATGAPVCYAIAPNAPEPVWQMTLKDAGAVLGGALADGRLYVTVEDGYLYALGESAP